MAKRKKTYSKKKQKKKAKQSSSAWKLYLFVGLFIVIFIAAFLFQEQLKYTYLKVKSTYMVYKNKYASKTEQEKIDKIIKLNQDKLFGLDISQYQDIINWDKVSHLEDSTEINFVILRATAGTNKKDKYFNYNWRESKSHGIIRGAYHYYRPNENSTEQANNFIDKVKLYKGDIAPILDIEEAPEIQSMRDLRKGIQNWLDIVEEEYGKKPIIYTGDSFYKDYLKGKGFQDYPLWIANYNKSIKHPKAKNWLIWQFTDQGKATGIGELVDLNVFDGNEKMFKLLLLD